MEKSFQRSIEQLSDVFLFADTFVADQQINPDHRETIHLVLEELFTHLVKYNRLNSRNSVCSRHPLEQPENWLSPQLWGLHPRTNGNLRCWRTSRYSPSQGLGDVLPRERAVSKRHKGERGKEDES